jgi:phosphoglycerol transferase MdoB-like AlkP superfamily enzyme
MPPPLLALSAVLTFVLVLAKLPISRIPALQWEYWSWKGLSDWVGITAQDMVVALAFLAVSSLVHRCLASWPRAQARFVMLVRWVAVIVAIYAVVNISIFGALKQPLNSRVLAMMKHVGDMKSSCLMYCNWQLFVSLVLAPASVWWGSRWLEKLAGRPYFARGLIAVTTLWMVAGFVCLGSTQVDSWQRRASRSAHCEILLSLAMDAFTDGRANNVIGAFAPAHLEDFKPPAERSMEPLGAAPRNVIVFVLESTSAQYLSLYGASYDTTPNLCAEAKNSLVFDRAYAHIGYTFCSFVSIAYSVYPGLPWQYRPGGERKMPKGLGAFLAERGYRTSFFAAANPEWGGMDEMAEKAGITRVYGPRKLAPHRLSTSWGCEDGPLMDGILKWIDEDRSKPFYSIAWTDQSHHPYTVSKDTPAVDFSDDGKPVAADKNRYLNAIRQDDYQLGRLFAALRERGLDKDTLVVITGDHGEAFGSPHPVMGHGNGLFDENLRVPLMFWSPQLYAGGRRIEKPAGLIDINPTLAHLLKIKPPASWQGCSLLSPEHPGRVYMMSDRDGYQFGVVDGTHKSIFYASGGYQHLYDLASDPLEQTDISSANQPMANDLRSRISAFINYEETYIKTEAPVELAAEPVLEKALGLETQVPATVKAAN